MPAESGSVLTLLFPKFTVVVPEPDIVKIPLAYPLARRDQDWAHFINTWIELKRRDGTIDALYGHWILGKQAAKSQPRWSIMRNVLIGWINQIEDSAAAAAKIPAPADIGLRSNIPD